MPGPLGSGIRLSEVDGYREAGLDRNHRMDLQYDGTGLHGWAKQKGLPTVEGTLEDALRTVLGTAPSLQVAGRTDAGVHARRQVVSLLLPERTELARLKASLNALTPPAIAVSRIERAPRGFDARKDATSRSYRYFISMADAVSPFWARYCWPVQRQLDTDALAAAAEAVAGRHDFTAFTPTETEHVFFDRLVQKCAWRSVSGSLPMGLRSERAGRHRPAGGMLYLEIKAEAFLRHMVRTLVGTMIEVADGTRDLDSFRGLLAGASRREAGPTAPAQGLFLWDVNCRTRARAGTDGGGE
jgi:tRNA pseudouridine38-40 synthase